MPSAETCPLRPTRPPNLANPFQPLRTTNPKEPRMKTTFRITIFTATYGAQGLNREPTSGRSRPCQTDAASRARLHDRHAWTTHSLPTVWRQIFGFAAQASNLPHRCHRSPYRRHTLGCGACASSLPICDGLGNCAHNRDTVCTSGNCRSRHAKGGNFAPMNRRFGERAAIGATAQFVK